MRDDQAVLLTAALGTMLLPLNSIAEEIERPVDHREVETDGARRAAEKPAELL